MTAITSAEVLALMNIDPDVADAAPAIAAAELVITENLTTQDFTDARLLQIELWLAAHFFEISWNQGGLVSKQVGDSKEEYNRQSAENLGFNSTRYGAQAVAFDTSGTLASIGSAAQRAEFRVV